MKSKKYFKLFYLSVVALVLVVLAACGGGSSDSSSTGGEGESKGESSGESGGDEITDELVIFNWTSYMPDQIIKDFEEEFGVNVTYTTFASNQEMLSKIRSGTVAYDIAVPSGTYVKIMADDDLLEEINFDNIPNYENINDQWKGLDHDPDEKYSLVYMYGYDGIIYNKDKIKDPPTSWEDLWNPDYKGHVILMDAADEISDMVQQYLGNDIQNPTEEDIIAGGEEFKKLVPNIMKYTEAPEAELVSGEAWIVYGYSGEAAVAYAENEDIDFVLPKEGGIKWTDNMVIPKTSENKATAEAFMNYLLRPEVSKQLSEEYPYGNPNDEAVALLDDEFLEVPGLVLPDEEAERAESAAAHSPEIMQVINKVIQEAKIKAGN